MLKDRARLIGALILGAALALPGAVWAQDKAPKASPRVCAVVLYRFLRRECDAQAPLAFASAFSIFTLPSCYTYVIWQTNFIPGISTDSGLHVNKWTPRLEVSGPLARSRAWFHNGFDAFYDVDTIHGLPRGDGSVRCVEDEHRRDPARAAEPRRVVDEVDREEDPDDAGERRERRPERPPGGVAEQDHRTAPTPRRACRRTSAIPTSERTMVGSCSARTGARSAFCASTSPPRRST